MIPDRDGSVDTPYTARLPGLKRSAKDGWEWERSAKPLLTAAFGYEPSDLTRPDAKPTVRRVTLQPSTEAAFGIVVNGLPGSYCAAPVFSFAPLDVSRLRFVLLGVVGAVPEGLSQEVAAKNTSAGP